MIYIKKKNESNLVYFPINEDLEGIIKKYDLQSKTIVVDSSQDKVVNPDIGYYGLSSVRVISDFPNIEENKTIQATSNGKYTVIPSDGFDALKQAEIDVNVPMPEHRLEVITKKITSNGESEITHSTDYYGIDKVNLEVDVQPDLESRSERVSANKTYSFTPTEGYDGLSRLDVTVAVPEKKIEANKTQSITTNGQTVITPTAGNDGMAKVTVKVNVPQTGSTINNQNKTVEINSNTTTKITADTGYTGLGEVTVTTNVPMPEYKSQVKSETITENKSISIIPSEGYDGLSKVDITVAVPSTPTQEKSEVVTENKTIEILPDEGYNLSKVMVDVNVPQTGTSINNQNKTIEITANTITNVAADEGFTGLGNVKITTNVPEKKIEINKTQSITTNGETVITPTAGNDGMAQVTVDVNVPQTGTSINNQDKTVSYSSNGIYKITADEDYTGLGEVRVNINVPQSGMVEKTTFGYDYLDVYGFIKHYSLNDYFDYTQQKYDEWNPENNSTYNLYKDDVNLVFAPKIDTSNVSYFKDMYKGCTNLVYVPEFISKGDDCTGVFWNCSKLKTINVLDLSQSKNFNSCFEGCESLTTLPVINFSNAIDLSFCFYKCASLEGVNLLNTNNVVSFAGMFRQCSKLISINNLDTSGGQNFYRMFTQCTSLISVPELVLTNANDCSGMFNNCPNLQNLGGFIGLKVDLDLTTNPLLTKESLLNVINKMADLTGQTSQTLTLGSTNLAKLTDDEKAIATSKNWILA